MIAEFYEKVQNVVDEIPREDVLYVIGDWKAKAGQDETNGTTGRFGLGERNSAPPMICLSQTQVSDTI